MFSYDLDLSNHAEWSKYRLYHRQSSMDQLRLESSHKREKPLWRV